MQWILLIISIILAFGNIGEIHTNYLFITISGLAIISNAWFTKNFRSCISLFSVAYIIGTLAEAVGLRYSLIFGNYFYTINETGIFNVPIQVSLFWAYFYYLTHLFVNRIFRRHLVFFDAMVMVGIDLLLDPVMVSIGAWKWKDGGVYFEIPWENFVGWFLVSLVISVVVRKSFKIKIYDKSNFGLVSLFVVMIYLISRLVGI